MKGYGHLSLEEIDRIALLRTDGLRPAAIAREIALAAFTMSW